LSIPNVARTRRIGWPDTTPSAVTASQREGAFRGSIGPVPHRPIRQAISFVELRESSERRAIRRRRLRTAGIVGGPLGVVVVLFILVSVIGSIHGASAENENNTMTALSANNPRVGVIQHEQPTPTPVSASSVQGSTIVGDAQAGTAGGASKPTSLDPEQLTGYKWPLRGARVTSFFEPRDDGTLVVDGQRIHEGLDLATYCGDTIRAAHAGTVVASGRRFDDEMGFNGSLDAFYHAMKNKMYELPIVVIIDDGNGYRSIYAHLGLATVQVGDNVKAGSQLGFEGASGNASGCHLHYELFRTDGPWMQLAPDLVKTDHYPPEERERIDPFRVLTMNMPGHPRFMPGVDPPAVSPGLGRPTVTRKSGH
jgi:murein DD-endopeptidase MepM/ murein hydrolase activator NlpD